MKNYDVVVLGAGPGGYVSAIRAAQLGAKTAIIEKNKVGGTCLNSGCIPTKALIKNVEILHSIEIGKKRGIKIQGELTLDYAKAVKAKNSAVKKLVGGVSGLIEANGIDFFQGAGVVNENKEIEVTTADGEVEKITYNKLIVATGSSPRKLPIEGMELEGVMTSEEALEITEVPENLVIIGGGVIGCEFANIFSAYGSKVTIVEMLPTVVANLDKDVSEYMAGSIEELGIDIKTEKMVKGITKTEKGLIVHIEDNEGEEAIETSAVLVSTGRQANLLGLEKLSLNCEKGYVLINDRLETNVEDVYAIGDVTGKKMLAHVASEMGVVAVENALGKEKDMHLDIVPSCIYTIPEVGCVGLTEAEAKEKYKDIVIGKFPLMACGKAMATGEPEGMFKLIADNKTKKVVGAHLIGKSATEVVAEMAAYMKMNATIEDVVDTIHAHPTISESIAEAARDTMEGAIHMPPKIK